MPRWRVAAAASCSHVGNQLSSEGHVFSDAPRASVIACKPIGSPQWKPGGVGGARDFAASREGIWQCCFLSGKGYGIGLLGLRTRHLTGLQGPKSLSEGPGVPGSSVSVQQAPTAEGEGRGQAAGEGEGKEGDGQEGRRLFRTLGGNSRSGHTSFYNLLMD